MEIKNILLLGAGAIGVLPTAKLLENKDLRVCVAAAGERLERYRRDGIFLNGKRLAFEFVSPDGNDPFQADLLLAATKTYALPDALESVRPFISAGTILLPLLNGITARDVLAAAFPEARAALYGVFLGHASVRDGNRVTHDGVGTIYFGDPQNDPRSPEAEAVASLFRNAGIDFEIPLSMRPTMWRKFILNIGINQTQALFRADYGEVQKNQELMTFAKNLMEEGAAVAAREGVDGTGEMIESALSVIRSMPPDVKTSMLQDVLAGRRTEVDSFAGEVCRRAEKYALAVPFNRRVFDALTDGMR